MESYYEAVSTAVCDAQYDELSLLLAQNNSLNSKEGKKYLIGWIWYAVRRRHPSYDHITKLLLSKSLKQGTLLEMTQETYGYTSGYLLYRAAQFGYQESVIFLIDNGAFIDIQDSSDDTPLHAAAYGGHAAIVALLLDRGASINLQNTRGMTPLHKAASERHTTVVEQLLKKNKLIINTQDKEGKTPLHCALYYDKQPCTLDGVHGNFKPMLAKSVIELLVASGADVNIPDKSNRTPLDLVASASEEIQMLLKSSSHCKP